MPSALLIAWLFPPHSSVGSKRPYRLARELARQGWRVSVLTQAQPVEALLDRDPPADLQNIQCIRRYDPPLLARAAAWLDSRQRKTHSLVSTNTTSLLSRLLPTEPALLYGPHAWHEVQRCIEREQPDVLFTTSYPFSAHLLGLAAKQKYGVRWVADFRDPWTLHWSHDHKSRVTRRIENALEASIMKHADVVTVTTESLQKAYQNRYPSARNKLHCVRNSFDDQVQQNPVDVDRSPVRLVHFGHVYGGARSLAPVLHALAKLRRVHHWTERDVVLENYGRFSADDLALAEQLGVRAHVQIQQTVGYAEGIASLQRAALLLLPTWQTEHGPLFLPAKLYDYLYANRPILALGSNPELAQILAETHAGILCSEQDNQTIETCIERAVAHPTNSCESVDAKVNQFAATAMGEQFAKLFLSR